MRSNILKCALPLLLLCASGWMTAGSPTNATSGQTADGGVNLTVTQISAAAAAMNWSATIAPYSVKVTDLTTNAVLSAFSTSNTSATISGLISGHIYRYEVADGTPIIDLVECGFH